MNLAQKIKLARERTGMTQAETAKLMGISQQAYSQYESGRRVPKPETIGRIAIALNINLEDMLSDGEVPFDELLLFLSGVTDQAKSEFDATKEDSTGSLLGKLKANRKNLEAANSLLDGLQTVMENQKQLMDLLLSAFYALNDEGKKKAIERVQELTEVPKYCASVSEQSRQQSGGNQVYKIAINTSTTERDQETSDTSDDKDPAGE